MGPVERRDRPLPEPTVPIDFRELVERSPAPCFETTADGLCTYVNRAWTALSGLSLDQSKGLGWMSVVVEEDLAGIRSERPAQIAAGSRYEQRFAIHAADGMAHSLLVETYPINTDGGLQGWLGWVTDETEQKQLRDALAERDALLEAVFDQSAAGLVIVDSDSRIVRANARFCEWMGDSEANLIGVPGLGLLAPEQKDSSAGRIRSVLRGEPVEPVHRTLVTADGREVSVWTTLGLIPSHDGSPPLLAVTLTEFASQHERELHLEHLAHHDPLTGLPNRRALEEWATRSTVAAAVLIDLNGFKALNDRHGHTFGDLALVQVGDRLRHCVRHTDLLCRFGGDEFLVMLADAPTGSIEALVARITRAFEEPFKIDDLQIRLSAAVGVAIGTRDAAQLAIEADADLYRNKSAPPAAPT